VFCIDYIDAVPIITMLNIMTRCHLDNDRLANVIMLSFVFSYSFADCHFHDDAQHNDKMLSGVMPNVVMLNVVASYG
jgi:hypothetical protein